MTKSTAKVQIVPRFKLLRLKLMAQQATVLVDRYETDRVNQSSCRKEKPSEN